jgi:D-alanyl-D-alanine carboxypeptidase
MRTKGRAAPSGCNREGRRRGAGIMACLILPVVFLNCGTCARTGSGAGTRTDRLADILDRAKKEFNIPALGVIALDSRGVIEQAIVGVRDIYGADPATCEDYFHLGSNTKSITGFIAAKLVQDGLIGWDARFFDLVPELAAASRSDYRDITLADLLSHRAWVQPFASGTELEEIPELKGGIMEKRIGFAEYVLKQKPTRTSGQSLFKPYAYSNAGYVLAAAMLERAGGRSWEELAHEVLVGDLGLSMHIGFPVELGSSQPRGHLPGAYIGKGKDTLMIYDTEYRVKHDDILSPAGNISMSMTDYAEFLRLNLQGLEGTDNYLTADMYRSIHFGIPQYAIGWENSRENNADVSSHSGSKGNFMCHARIIKDRDLAMVVFANSGIVNALDPISRFFGEMKLEGCLDEIQRLFETL